jgi:hypothetical protein
VENFVEKKDGHFYTFCLQIAPVFRILLSESSAAH